MNRIAKFALAAAVGFGIGHAAWGQSTQSVNPPPPNCSPNNMAQPNTSWSCAAKNDVLNWLTTYLNQIQAAKKDLSNLSANAINSVFGTPSNGQCVVGSNGSWVAGSCGGVGGSGFGVQTGQSPQVVGDDNVPITSGHYLVTTSAVLTGNRTHALPLASAQGVGELGFYDSFQGIAGGFTMQFCATSPDSMAGSVGGCSPAISNTGAFIQFHSDGNSPGNWSIGPNSLIAASTAPTGQFATGLTSGGLAYDVVPFSALSGTSGVVAQYGVGGSFTAENIFYNTKNIVTTISGTTHNTAEADCGTTLLFTSSSAVTVTAVNSVGAGCSIAIEQGGTGQVTVTAGAGASLNSAFSYSATRTQYSIIGLRVDTNSGGSSAHYVLVGDGA